MNVRVARFAGLVTRLAGRLRRAPESTRLSHRLEIYGRNAERVP